MVALRGNTHLISKLEDFINVDYKIFFSSTSASDQLFKHFTNPLVPFLSVFLYLVLSTWIFTSIQKTFKLQPKGWFLQLITISHSSILAIYSAWTCWNAWAIAVPYVLEHGYYAAICDTRGELWHIKGLGFWVTHFYLSKYYEFIDTWIVLLKGRQPLFLQTYHHAGVVLLMWGFIVTDNTASGMILICLNSFIHTLMYTYYVLAAFGINSPLKNYLTMAQIVQFLVGIVIITPAYFCVNDAQKIVIFALQVYAIYLTYLFYQFYQASYVAKKNSKSGVKKIA